VFGRITALWLLGWSLVFTLLRRWTFRTPGLRTFQANYAGDRILLLDRDDQTLLQSFTGCVACGRCDYGERERIVRSGGEYPGLMPLVLSSLRSTRELEAAALGWKHVPASVLRSKELVCPTRVPFASMKQFVEKKVGELATSRGALAQAGDKP
jgi:hypothetical protein